MTIQHRVSKLKLGGKEKLKLGKEGIHVGGPPWGAGAKWGVKSIYMGLPLTKSGTSEISKYVMIIMGYKPLNKRKHHEPMWPQINNKV